MQDGALPTAGAPEGDAPAKVPAVPWDRSGHSPAAGTPFSPSSCYDIVLLLLCFSPGAFSSSPLPHPAATRQKLRSEPAGVGRAAGRGKHPAAPPVAGQGEGWQPPVPVATSNLV